MNQIALFVPHDLYVSGELILLSQAIPFIHTSFFKIRALMATSNKFWCPNNMSNIIYLFPNKTHPRVWDL